MQLASELPGSGVIVNQSKQQVPLHVACSHGLMNLTRQLLHQPGASLDMVDGAGNSLLHCAASAPTGLDLVKMLLNEMGANVCAKNHQGQTPYDVATLNSIRQYLLPIQLQQETREALQNGGTGLPPGIDMGGLKIQNSAMPPPPMGGASTMSPPPQAVGPPPIMGMTGPPAQGMPPSPYPQPPFPGAAAGMPASPYPQPPFPGATAAPVASPYPPPPFSGGEAPAVSPYPQPPFSGGAAPAASPYPAAASQTPPVSQGFSQPVLSNVTPPVPLPPDQTVTPVPASAPKSSGSMSSGKQRGYALTGSSSAAIYKGAPGSGGIRPDGFHSSSSDKGLQEKYGNSHHQSQYSHIAPPPSSGSSPSVNLSASGSYGNGPPSSGGSNPYAGGRAQRQRPNPYASYNYGPGQMPVAAAAQPYAQSYGMPSPAAGQQLNVFTPGGAIPQVAPAPASGGFTASPMPPPPYQSQQQAPSTAPSAYQTPATAAYPQQPAATQPYGVAPAAQPAYTPSPVVQPYAPSSAPLVSPAGRPSAASMFATPVAATPPPAVQASPQSTGSAHDLFARPAETAAAAFQAPSQGNLPVAASPADMFAAPPPQAETAASPMAAPSIGAVPKQIPYSSRDVSVASELSNVSDFFTKPPATSASAAFASPPTVAETSSTVVPGQSTEAPPAQRSETPKQQLVADVHGEEDFDQMDDIPLSPQPVNPNTERSQDQATARNPGSLHNTLGMPPPPFTRK
jgi:hypothetical protein